jgi:hypothetical protein
MVTDVEAQAVLTGALPAGVIESKTQYITKKFKVKTDGSGVKSPMEMFEEKTVPNDLKLVNEKINAYYKGAK